MSNKYLSFADEQHANFRLIAAAPDMLTALQNILSELKLYNGWHPDNEICTALIESTINKATL